HLARAREVALPGSAPDAAAPGTPAPTLTRGNLRVSGGSVVPILRDAAGEPLAWWRASGLGRIGIAGFDDSFRLVLAGDAAAQGDLWATLFSLLARPAAAAPGALAVDAWRGERVALCGLPANAEVAPPEGARVALRVDPATGARACAGFWPRMAGWHVLYAGAAARPFYVRDPATARGLRAAALREATAALATAAPAGPRPGPLVPGPRWPWFLGWLALSAAGWWFERSRLGRAAPR
ncbi:MAG: carboxypeptidase regulatory-like domain-containing protein, partial [Lysobacteraceae bacterium]